MSSLAFIAEAVRNDPRLKLAAGVAQPGAVVAAVLAFAGGNYELAVIGGLFVVGFMILLLLEAAGSKDRTLRIYASEFLYDLGDPEMSRQALALAAKTDDENARYNWLLVAQGGWHKLDAAQKQAAGADLGAAHAASGPETRKLFDKLK